MTKQGDLGIITLAFRTISSAGMSIRLTCGRSQVQVLYRPPKCSFPFWGPTKLSLKFCGERRQSGTSERWPLGQCEGCEASADDAGIAHLVERHLAKVEVASSSLVARSKKAVPKTRYCFFHGQNRTRYLHLTIIRGGINAGGGGGLVAFFKKATPETRRCFFCFRKQNLMLSLKNGASSASN